jgi:hypothetical protein
MAEATKLTGSAKGGWHGKRGNQWLFARGRPTTSSSGASTAAFGACCRPLNWTDQSWKRLENE